MNKTVGKVVVAASVMLALVTSGNSQAAVREYRFSGVVDVVADYGMVGTLFSVGDAVRGQLFMEDSPAGVAAYAGGMAYKCSQSASRIVVTVNGLQFETSLTSPWVEIWVNDAPRSRGGDIFQIESYALDSVPSEIGPIDAGWLHFALYQPYGGAINSNDLPKNLSIGPWQNASLQIAAVRGAPVEFDLEARINSILLVPEPASWVALATGLVGLFGTKRRK